MNRPLHAAGTLILALMGAFAPFAGSRAAPEDNGPSAEKTQAACIVGDCQNGTGTYRYASGDVYAGGFLEGLREGAGSYKFANGDILNTTFRRGRAAGSGTYVFADGRVFRGEFSNTARALTGRGLLNEKSGSRFCVLRNQVLECDGPAGSDGAQSSQTGPGHLLMLFARDTCRIVRDGRTLKGGPGIPLYAGDRIESGSEAVELQGRGGIAIRLRPFSVLEIPPGTLPDRSGVLYLRKGGVAVDYQGDPEKIPFRINAQNTNFDVNGTTFTVEIDDARGTAKVRVYEGTVTVSPSIPALEKLDLEQATSSESESGQTKKPLSDEELQKVADALLKQTMKVGANQAGELSDEAREKAQALNAAVEKTVEARKQSEKSQQGAGNDAEEAAARQLAQSAEQLIESPAARPEAFEATPQESAELKLLITVDEDTLEQSLAGGSKSAEQLQAERASVQNEYDQKLDTRASALQKELAADQNIRTQADLIKRYKFLEVITFRDGKQKAGSIAAQAGSILIMHAPDGVFRLSRDDVKQIDYYDVVPENMPPGNPQ